METEDSEDTEIGNEFVVDLSKHFLKKIERADENQSRATVLILDDNEIQRLDNLNSYPALTKLSLVNNQLIRMFGVSHLTHLVDLNLSHNSIVTIEGLKDLIQLKKLNLSKNKIKTIDHLHHNVNLETLDISENTITHISDISSLKNLKELGLNCNKIAHLRNFDKYLPLSVEVLMLHNNLICDLNEVSILSGLTVLKELTFCGNPCVVFGENQKTFNYRPFIKNWCSSLIVLDNSPLDDIECLKAEWLYSQGRGRSFRLGENLALSEYLTSVCPIKSERNADHEDVKKLKLILSKAQLHQQQLREELSTGNLKVTEGSCKLPTKKKTDLTDRMLLSFQESSKIDTKPSADVMTRSLDSSALRNSPPSKLSSKSTIHTPLETSSTFIPVPDSLISPDLAYPAAPTHTRSRQKHSSVSSRASYASSKNSTPESKRKLSTCVTKKQSGSPSPKPIKTKESNNSRSSTPMCRSSSSRNTYSPGGKEVSKSFVVKNQRETSDEESDVLATKAQAIQMRKLSKKQISELRRQKAVENFLVKKTRVKENIFPETEMWNAAVCIQKWWRGYRARNLNRQVVAACKNIQINRMQDYIMKMVNDMEATKIALEGNRKLQVLQMQAINALWKKVSSLQPSEAAVESGKENQPDIHSLVETCSKLNKQVEGLQKMMQAMQERTSSVVPNATQTEIVAVHTPQGETDKGFPPFLSSCSAKNNSGESNSVSLADKSVDSCTLQNDSKEQVATTSATVTELFTSSMAKDISKETICELKELKIDSFSSQDIAQKTCPSEEKREKFAQESEDEKKSS